MKNRINNKKLLLLTPLLIALLFPILASAQTIKGIIDNVSSVIQYIARAVVIILWIITGILFLSAQGDPSKLTTAKKALFASIIGTAIVILATIADGLIKNALFYGM